MTSESVSSRSAASGPANEGPSTTHDLRSSREEGQAVSCGSPENPKTSPRPETQNAPEGVQPADRPDPGNTSSERGPERWQWCRDHGHADPRVWACPTCLVELRRWKSTNAPRLLALEGLLQAAQREAAGAQEAIATLASEREANALLTEKVWQLELAEEGAKQAFADVVQQKRDAEQERDHLREQLTAAHAQIRSMKVAGQDRAPGVSR